MTSQAPKIKFQRADEYRGKVFQLGEYRAEGGDISGLLTLQTKIIIPTGCASRGDDLYLAEFSFRTTRVPDGNAQYDPEQFTAVFNYADLRVKGVFDRIKRASSGIEAIFAPITNPSRTTPAQYDLQTKTDVLRCILSLEDQTAHIEAERQAESARRQAYIFQQ